MIQESVSLKYEPASEPLHISVVRHTSTEEKTWVCDTNPSDLDGKEPGQTDSVRPKGQTELGCVPSPVLNVLFLSLSTD